jgi:predicted kinase
MIQPTIDFIGDITVEPTTPTPTTPVTPDDFGDLPEGFFDDVLLTQVGKDTGVIKSENVEGIITPDAVGDEYGGDFSISEGIMSFLPLKGNEEIYKEYNLLSEDGKLKKLPDNAKTKKWVDTLNKSPYYQFRLRHLSDGTYRILIVNPYSDYSPAISEDYITPIKQGKQNIKQGVSELFESNPELANKVYEALGFKTKPDVILPIGTSGSGKSTFIKSLPQENLVVIEPDAMRVEFTGNMNDKSKDKEIYEEAAKRAVVAIKQGKQVVFDTTNLTKDKRLPFIKAIKKEIPAANIQYKLMELNPELAKQRIKAQLAKGENRAAVSDETIDRHAASYKQMLEDIKSEPISNYEITPQQKQQAQQLYSQYLDTIFPDSKVKDIVYHGTTINNLQSIIEKGFSKDKQRNTGFHLGTKEAANNAVISVRPAENRRIVPVIINSKNPERTADTINVDKDGDLEWQDKIQKAKGDSFIYENNREDNGKDSYVVFEPEQIHILGTKQDIEGFKQFVDNKNFAISEETVERVKELGKDLLVTDGDYTFGAGKQKQIVDNIKFLVYTDLLSLVKEGKRMAVSKAFSNAKESLIKTKKNIEFIANLTEEKFQQLLNNPKAKELYGHIESVEQAKYIASELERITKDEVFKQFEGQVVQDLKVLGITVKEEKLQDLSDEEKDDIVTDEDDAVDEEEQTQNVKSFSVEVFQVNPRNTAGINVKLMLSKIPNSNRNYLGLSSYIPFDTVFDDLTVALSPVEGSLKSYIQEMKNIINGNPAKSYLKNLVEVLESPETATSMKNQFVAVMNKHLGNFVLTLWKRTPNGMEVQTKYANENSAVSVIVNQWAENMGQSRIVTTDSKGNKHIDKTVAAELNDKIKQLQGKGKEAHKEFMLELFDALGIFIDPNIVDVLYNTTQYKELDPKGKRKGNFEYQFTYSSTGVPQGVFSAIVDALNKENSKEIIEAAEDLMQLNNPFDGANKNSSVTFLAQVVAKYSNVHYASSHRNVENKMIYDSSFHIPITSRIKDLNVPNSPTRAILKELPFSSTAYWLSDSAKNIKLIMHDMDGLKERGKNTDGVTRTSMSEREQEFTSIGLFQDTESEHTAKFIGMTMSDKSRTPIIEAPKFKVNINTTTLKDRHITKETLTEDSKEQISNLVKAEAARIRNIRQRIKEDIDNKLKNEVGEQYYNGAQFFYFFPELNGLVYKDGKLDDTMLLNENLQVLIDTALDKVVETVNNTIDKWWNIGIVYRDKKNRIATMFNKNYVSNSHLKDNALIAYAATDIELNYIVFNANMMQLVQGDPAKFYNQKKVGKFDVVTRISKVMDEYQKREAKDAAPGEIGTADWEFTDKNGIVRKGRPTYNVVFAADDKFGSITQGYLQTMPSYTEGLDRTDAQELTTLREHIDLLMNHGRIPDDIYASIMKKIEDAGVGGYYELTYDELGMVLGPQKPVQIVSRFDNGVESTFYIKSSSYPLIPQLTRGFGEDSDIEKIRVNMEKNNVDRLAFITATKIGARNTVELFKDGKVVEDLDFSDKLNQLSRKGFTIQQDVPYDPKKHEIVVISQMDRLLMQGLSDVEFEFKGKKLLGKELKKIKENLRGQLMDMSKEDIFDRMGIEMVDGNPVVRNLDKLISILREEAIDRKWAVNDIMALQIVDGNLVIPLAFNNSAERVETLISSLFTKIIKQKISGKSFVQASSSGYKNNTKTLDDLTASDKKGIVFLKGTGNDFNPKTGLTYTNLNEETKEVKVAQVFIPWKYSGNLEDFVKEGTSELDLNKIDPELLKMIGARIPNQGHSSQIVLQVVGFLPKVLGDLVIVPGEITKQMGSDFDVDKLYTYMYNNVVNAEGRLVKVPSAISENGDIDTKSLMDWAKDNFAKGKLDFGALSELDEDTDKKIKEGLKLAGLSKKALIKAALQNAYIEVHETVLTNSEVVKKALTPLDADDLSITGDNASTKQDRGLFISRDRQLKDFIRQQAGKSGVAIMSRAVVGGAMIEDYNLRLGTPTEKGYKDTPFKGFLDDSGDAIALINLSGEGKTEFNGEERTKTRNTIIMQSGAVDNANKPVLDSNNLNSFTFNTAIAINRLSSEEGRILDLRYTSYFLNQEVIKDYINELKSLSDTLNEEFTADRKNAAVEKVKENYLKRAGLKEYKVVGKGFTPQMMLDLIKSNEKNSNEYIKDQLEILEHFVYLDTVGTELNEIYGALSTESKGVGKGYWDVLIRQEQLRKLGRKSTISGAAELLEEGSQANKIAGYVYDAVKVMSQIFPYQTTQVQEIINTIEIYAGKTYTDKNLRQLIWENIKSYIFTHPDLATTPEDRNALFYGENSVAKEIERFKKTPEGFNNRFMQRVRTKLGKTADMPDLVLLNASAAERTDEQEVVKHFVDLLTSPNEGTRELGERLIQYQFATGGLQKALQYVKYIPVSYLATTNFGTKLMEIINSLNDENSININAFIEQFYQHNPARARIYKEEVTDKILNEGIKFNVETDRVNNLLYTKDNVQDYVPYISIRDKKGNWVLLKKERYEGITLVYKPIAVLGGHGKDYTSYNEYKFDTENVVSTIESNNPKNTILPQSKIVPTTKEEPTITNTEVYTVKGNKYVNPFNASPSENLNFAMANLETERFKALAPLFTKNSNLLSDKFEIIIDNNLEYTDSEGNKRPARGLYYKGKVYLNPKVINNNVKTQGRDLTTEDIEKTLMHELGHAYTADLYRIYSEGGTHKLLTPKVKQNFERIDALRNVAYNMLTKEEKEKVNKIKTGKYGTPEQGINNEDLKTYYGFINTKEFISEVLTKPEFQKKLNEMSLNSTTSVFERVVKFIREIYNEFIKTLGFTVKQNSVLENSLLEVMDLIHNSENVEKIIESKISNIKDKIEFKEEQTSGYRNRTIKNASADATIAMAIDFNSAGEKLTKSSVLSQNKKYIPVDANKLEVTEQRVNNIVNSLNSINKQRNLFDNNGISLNIAGNGLYTMKGKYTQEQIDEFTYQLLKAVVESPNLKNKIEFIRTGGQTGFDEAGAKAGIRLGIPTTILAPKGWVFRDINGRDISNEQQFKNRFNIEITTNKEETLPSISEISNKEVSLQMSVGDYMKTLTKEQRELLRNLVDQKIIEFRCK